MVLLCIDTGTSVCSVALGNADTLHGTKAIADSRAHSAQLTLLIEEVLNGAKQDIKLIDAVVINKGPGSYTGLRIGVSTAKGICYALNKPLISVGGLEAMAHGIVSTLREMGISEDVLLCPMIDARRMEVYTAVYDSNLNEVSGVEAKIVYRDSFAKYLAHSRVVFFGSGASKCKTAIDHPNAIFIENFEPSAAHLLPIGTKAFEQGAFEDVAYFEPFYLKDFVAIKGRNKVLGDI